MNMVKQLFMLYVRAMKEHKTIFGVEEKTIEKAETVLKDQRNQDNPLREEFQWLLKHYKRMFEQFRRLIKLSDGQQLQLKLAYEKIEVQNQELLEAARLREDVERITQHDLKNPLSTIIAVPTLLMGNEHLSPKEIDYLVRIEESGLKMLNMINHSLDLFKMERGLYQISPVPVNILHVLKKVAVETAILQQSKQVSLEILLSGIPVHDDANTLFIEGEELLCYSMLANLLKNALEASPARKQVTVNLEPDHSTVAIIIHNYGMVAEAIQGKFFDKYVTFGKQMGTGLGTYSAKLSAEIQGGSILMTTSEQQGTFITVRLPKIDIMNSAFFEPAALPNADAQAISEKLAKQKYPFTPEILDTIPPELLKMLRHAVLMLDIPAMHKAIEQIRAHNVLLADAATHFVSEYRFDTLHNILNP